MSIDVDLIDLYECAHEELYFELDREPTLEEIDARVEQYKQQAETHQDLIMGGDY